MNTQPEHAAAQVPAPKLKHAEIAPVSVLTTVRSPLDDLLAHPTEDALVNWFGPNWRFAIVGTELEALVLERELFGLL